MTDAVILAVGRREAGDDAVGPYLLDRLGEFRLAARLRQVRADPGDLASALDDVRCAILVDACRSGVAPGSIRRFDLTKAPLGAPGPGRHGMDLAAALDLVRGLIGLPPVCELIVIEGAEFGLGQSLSPAVQSSADRLTAELRDRFRLPDIAVPFDPPPKPARSDADRGTLSGVTVGADRPSR